VGHADFLNDLNPQQRQAVESLGGPVLVLAGPGSGKTRVLTYRIAYLVRVCGVKPQHILAVTFTNKAAREMRDRLVTLLGEEQVHRLTAGTFHAVCARILRREATHLGLDPQFLIYDADDQIGLVKQAMQELNLDEKQYQPAATLYGIGRAKDELLDPAAYAEQVSSYWEEITARVYKVYQRKLRENRALDFDDLLMQTVQLFEQHPEVRQRYQQRFQHVLVDEYQDTNHAQYVLVRHLSGGYRNLFVVGDEEQAIYAWRGATLRNILEFERDFPESRVILLEQNYRSTRRILQAAGGVIAASAQRPYKKNLWTENSEGQPVIVREAYDEREEATQVGDEITRLLDRGYHPRDIAVMYRTNAQSRTFEEAFLRYGLRYKLVGGTRFYQRREVRDILAYLRLIHNPYDSVSLLRIINVPPREIGSRTVEGWRSWATEAGQPLASLLDDLGSSSDPLPENLPFTPRAGRALRTFRDLLDNLVQRATQLPLPQLLDELLERIGYRSYLLEDRESGQDRWENVQELRTVAQDYAAMPPGQGLAAFLEQTALIADIDEYDDRSEAITLITLHQAKGLEFPIVFIVGMEEGLLPHARSMANLEELEEERRLCYVGMTRAKERLYLWRAFKRTIFGSSDARAPSRFLGQLDPAVVSDGREREHPPFAARPGRARALERPGRGRGAQRPVPAARIGRSSPAGRGSRSQEAGVTGFAAGQKVRHPTFGEGMVVSVREVGDDQELTVVFLSQGIKRLLASYAKLERI
jgi:DNA helicase-2/ATP-dependent DNA helicase PcrA